MGQGRGKGSRADTLGTQGLVYATVSQTELANQSDIQGRFSLS